MKRLFVIVLMLVGVISIQAQTELYSKYSTLTNVKVACVNNLALDSVSRVEVTIMEAMDDVGWKWILEEFQLGSHPQGEKSVMFSMRNKHDPAKSAPIIENQVDLDNSCYIGVDYNEQTLYIFASEVGSKKDAIVKYLLKKMIGLAP